MRRQHWPGGDEAHALPAALARRWSLRQSWGPGCTDRTSSRAGMPTSVITASWAHQRGSPDLREARMSYVQRREKWAKELRTGQKEEIRRM